MNLHAHTYVRLDGSTKPEQRQALMQRFNSDTKIFAFILSTRRCVWVCEGGWVPVCEGASGSCGGQGGAGSAWRVKCVAVH